MENSLAQRAQELTRILIEEFPDHDGEVTPSTFGRLLGARVSVERPDRTISRYVVIDETDYVSAVSQFRDWLASLKESA